MTEIIKVSPNEFPVQQKMLFISTISIINVEIVTAD